MQSNLGKKLIHGRTLNIWTMKLMRSVERPSPWVCGDMVIRRTQQIDNDAHSDHWIPNNFYHQGRVN